MSRSCDNSQQLVPSCKLFRGLDAGTSPLVCADINTANSPTFFHLVFFLSSEKNVFKKNTHTQGGSEEDVPGPFLSDLFAISESFDLWQLIAS